MVFNMLSSRRDHFFFHISFLTLESPLAVVSLFDPTVFIYLSHTFLPSEPGLGLPAEDVKSSQGAKATVSSQWLE